MHARAWVLSGLLMSTTGCATMAPQQVGQVAGTIAGAAVIPGIGAPLGGLVGILAGMLFQGQVDRVTEKKERVELSQRLGTGPTDAARMEAEAARSAQPVGLLTRVWVDEAWQGGRLVAGHFEQQYIQ